MFVIFLLNNDMIRAIIIKQSGCQLSYQFLSLQRGWSSVIFKQGIVERTHWKSSGRCSSQLNLFSKIKMGKNSKKRNLYKQDTRLPPGYIPPSFFFKMRFEDKIPDTFLFAFYITFAIFFPKFQKLFQKPYILVAKRHF